jgi:glycosyltransferase involved in cell wall biosynthesis
MMLESMGYEAYPLVMGEYIGNFFGYSVEIKYINDVGYNLNKDDIVVSPEFLPYLGLKFKGCTKVLFIQSQAWRHYNSFLEKDDQGNNYFELGYDYVISCSQYLYDMLKLKMSIDSTAITNGIDQTKFSPLPAKRVKGRVLALSRKHPEQIKKIIDYTETLDLEFHVVDGLTEKDLIAEYQQADIFLAMGYPEGFSLPPLEAMSCGCVVVGFTGGGANEFMIDQETALVSSDGNCAGVAQNLEKLLANSALKERIRGGGLAKSKQYTLENTKRMLNDFYAKIDFEQ